MPSPSPRASEDSLIARFFAPIAGEGGLGLRDDAARLSPRPGHDLVLTLDALVERGHFLPEDAPASIARKALGVNVSDLAAKGAEPVGFLLGLALPADWTEDWLAGFAAGLGKAAREWSCPLLGGDTVKASGALTLSVTALGEVPAGRMVRRTAARPGDAVCVTGTIGDAALGLRLRASPAWADALAPDHRAHLADRYLHPRPRIAFAVPLREHAHAAMDVSDGLVGDLAKLCRASGVTAEIEAERVPLSPAAAAALRADSALLESVLTGGDDYEILCTLPLERLAQAQAAAEAAGLSLTAIGTVREGSAPPLIRVDGAARTFAHGSFSHF
jgi:thiamine-monophosphate kinase